MQAPAKPVCRLCIVFVAAGVSGAATAAERAGGKTPAEWLHTMDSATRNLNYDGVFSYYTASHSQFKIQQQRGDRAFSVTMDVSRDHKMASFRIVHMVIDGVERERIVHLGGPQREILRTGGQVSYVLPPDDRSFVLKDDLPPGPYTRLFVGSQDLAAYYRVGISGESEVIGRSAVCLEVNPLDGNRYGYLLWVDKETGLLLRSELRDANGIHLEMVEFTQIRVGDSVAANALEPAVSGVVVRPADGAAPESKSRAAAMNWNVGWVPAGFRMTDAHIHDQAKEGVHLMYDDGLATFSLFVERAPETRAGDVFSRSGATVLLSHGLSGERGRRYLVTVVGEVPPETAQRIAASVYRNR